LLFKAGGDNPEKDKVLCLINDNRNKAYTPKQAELLLKEIEVVLKMSMF